MPDPAPNAYDRYRRGLLTRHVTCAGRYLQQMWLKEPEASDPSAYRYSHQRQFLVPRVIAGWTNKRTFDTEPSRARSDDGPALLAANGRLYIAWSGRGQQHRLNWMSTVDGVTWTARTVIGQSSEHSPSLAYFQGRFYIAWTGTDDEHHLNIM